MSTIQSIADFLEYFAPNVLAESWDNVGLLVGDRQEQVQRVMTCLTVTPESADEAVDRRANLIIAHHPLPFHATKQITADNPTGSMLLKLIRQHVAIYSPHTAFDSATSGINQQLAEALHLEEIVPLVPIPDAPLGAGGGRVGVLPDATTLDELAGQLKTFLAIDHLQLVNSSSGPVRRVAVACGAAGEFLDSAREANAELLVLGETNFHTCLAARARRINLILTGHFASERFAVENLAQVLASQFPDLEVWASESESDPIQNL